jgi:hypothetical protein
LSGTTPSAVDIWNSVNWLFGTPTLMEPPLKYVEQMDTASLQPDAGVLSSLSINVNDPFCPLVENVNGRAMSENAADALGGGVGGATALPLPSKGCKSAKDPPLPVTPTWRMG